MLVFLKKCAVFWHGAYPLCCKRGGVEEATCQQFRAESLKITDMHPIIFAHKSKFRYITLLFSPKYVVFSVVAVYVFSSKFAASYKLSLYLG